MIIAVDFDGTCVTHEFPNTGEDIGAAPVLRELVKNGHQLILLTMRSNDMVIHRNQKNKSLLLNSLNYATDWFRKNEIELWAVNCNPNQKEWTASKKVYANIYIDDAALGVPLKFDAQLCSRPFVDWVKVRELLVQKQILE